MEKNSEKTPYLALIITSIIIVVIILAFITSGFGLFNKPQTVPDILEIGNSPVLGDPNAPITIYEFSDFSCPACAYAATEILPEIEKEYVNTGKAKIVFKYFPGHGTGKASHLVALAANEQNLFWKFNEYIFKHQENLQNIEEMEKIAVSLGANLDKLTSDLNNNNYEAQLNQDIELGRSIGIKGTPTFIINGKMITGAQPVDEFKKIIEKEL